MLLIFAIEIDNSATNDAALNVNYADFDRLSEEYTRQKDRIVGYQERIKSLQDALRLAEKLKQRQKDA